MKSKSILEQAHPIMPVVQIDDATKAKPLADALLAAGVHSIEITLRTPAAFEALSELQGYQNDIAIGVGTVTSVEQLKQVHDLNVDFVISPGFSSKLAQAAVDLGVNWIPGVSSGSEILQGMEFGLDCFKLFPAAAIGGIALLKSLYGPFPTISFCPTGGINEDNASSYLELPNVICVGGSWIAPTKLINEADWLGIQQLSNKAISKVQM